MDRVVVVGAGVVGQVYAGLLAHAGHRVSIVARGSRADRLRVAGVVLDRDGDVVRPPCRIVDSIADDGPVDVVIVAVRGDQVPSVHDAVAACGAATVVCLANPLQHRGEFARRVGADRTVFAFSGIGGHVTGEGVVAFHTVRQQPTVVDAAAPHGPDAVRLLGGTGLSVRSEPRMAAWLDTHSVFIAGIGSALRTIFGRVPRWFATRYWQRQCAGPTVQVAIEPHVVATRDTEFPQIVAYARSLVGDDAPRYRRLLDR